MNRKAIPRITEIEVLTKCRRRCALCVHLDDDWAVKEGQIAHIDRDHSNVAEDNLSFLCLQHHNKYDAKTNQSKGFQVEELRAAKQRLEARLREYPESIPIMNTHSSDMLQLSPGVSGVNPEVYHLRLPVYDAFMTIVSSVVREAKIRDEEIDRYIVSTREALFLFGEDIDAYCHEVYSNGIHLRSTQIMLKEDRSLSKEQWRELIDKQSVLLKWFYDQVSLGKVKFLPFLKLASGLVIQSTAPRGAPTRRRTKTS